MADVFRGDYDQLKEIASKFRENADAIGQADKNIKSKMEKLRGGDWYSVGANKFYQEMDSAIIPAMTKLNRALDEAGNVTNKIAQITKRAEDESKSCFILIAL
ncbi:MAG: WXG100 family type VII secretion target [Chloroflexota bacterium]